MATDSLVTVTCICQVITQGHLAHNPSCPLHARERAASPETGPTKQEDGKLRLLGMLAPNWDSYGAPAISSKALDAARGILASHPEIVPTGKGGVQLEWVNGEVVVEILPSGEQADESAPETGPGAEGRTHHAKCALVRPHDGQCYVFVREGLITSAQYDQENPQPVAASVAPQGTPDWKYLACEACGSIERIPTEDERKAMYEDYIKRGLSHSEAAGTAWPEPPSIPCRRSTGDAAPTREGA